MKKNYCFLGFFASVAFATPILQMNKAFNALSDLIPYITDQSRFQEKKNEKLVIEKISEMQKAFKEARHDSLLKEDIFAPSYTLINESINGTLLAFKDNKKDYAHWRIKEITGLCIDCHTRLPTSYSSSFQNGELTIDKNKFDRIYNLGIGQMIVRRYVDAKMTFTQDIDEKILKKNFKDIDLPFKQLLLIDTKVLNNPGNLIAPLETYLGRKDLPEELKKTLSDWVKRLKIWKEKTALKNKLNNDKELTSFIQKELVPLKKQGLTDGQDVDLLIVSGILSRFSFENPHSKLAPEISYWLGWSEKYLKRENFFGSGDLFLKQCIKRYPKNPIAKECLTEYKESVEFDFSGSGGIDIPEDIKKELKDLEHRIKK